MLNSYRSGARLIPPYVRNRDDIYDRAGRTGSWLQIRGRHFVPVGVHLVYIGHHVDEMGAYGHKMSTSVTNEPVEI